MTTKKLLFGIFAWMTLAVLFTARSGPQAISTPISGVEASRILGGQAGACYQMAPNNCPSDTSPNSCPACTLQNLLCENGTVIYQSYFCYDDGSYHFGSSWNRYQSAIDMGGDAKNGNTGRKQTGTVDCGTVYYCSTASQNPTCSDLTPPCSPSNFGTWYCKTLSATPMDFPIYSPDPATPTCPKPMSRLQRLVPTFVLATAWRNGVFYRIHE